jgi:hypothetical protein
MERRLIATELRAAAAGDSRAIAGYAALFNTLSVVLWDFREEIAPGAFAGTLANDVRALWNHDVTQVLGRTTNQSLRLREDSIGLAFDLDLPDTQLGRDVYTLIARGDVTQMSFAFRMLPEGDEWRIDGAGQYIRRLLRVDLVEISPVTFAAYPETSVDVRMALWGERVQIPDAVRRAAPGVGVDSMAAAARARRRAMTEVELQLATRCYAGKESR